jgi:hypothetical protein
MVLVAIAPTKRVRADPGADEPRRRRARLMGMPGLWTLAVTNLAQGPTRVDAWIEREDAGPDRATGSRQAYFPDSAATSLRIDNAAPQSTLNGIATFVHQRLHVVGAMQADGSLSDYSAAGPARPPSARKAPDAVVVADQSRGQPGVRTLGFLGGGISRIDGTSAASAVYAQALASALCRNELPPGRADKRPTKPVPESSEHQPQAAPQQRGIDKRRTVEPGSPGPR